MQAEYSQVTTDGTSSGRSRAQHRSKAPSSPHSHHSSSHALGDEEVSRPIQLPVPCFQPKPAFKQELSVRVVKRPTSTGFAPCGPAPNFVPEQQVLPAIQLSRSRSCHAGKELSDALCEAGIVDVPTRRSNSEVLALSSSTQFVGEDEKGDSSESENEEAPATSSREPSSPRDSLGSGDSSQKSSFRGFSYDKEKHKWRVQIKVANLGKSGEVVGYFDSEEAAANAYDRTAISLSGKDNGVLTNFALKQHQEDIKIPHLIGKPREEVKATLKNERTRLPRKKYSSRQRTSKYMGVGSSNRKNQWQARILVHGKVTHLGYYETEEEAAKVYDRVALSLNGPNAQTNFPSSQYNQMGTSEFKGLGREDLQRALGVKPMDKSSQFRGVSRKKGKWEAKVMVNRKWAYRALFDGEDEAARAYDAAVWRLKPREAVSFVNFKDDIPSQAGKRTLRGPPAATRMKSQKLESKSSAGSLPPLVPLQSSPGLGSQGSQLTELDLMEGPTTPSRRHSVQLPLSQPLKSCVISRVGSAAAMLLEPAAQMDHSSASLPTESEKVAQLQQEDIMQLPSSSGQPKVLAAVSPQQSFSRCSSYTQLQPTLSGLPLPDPNSIGVPPPDNLPYPELVSVPLSTHSSTGSLLQQCSTAATVVPVACGSSSMSTPRPSLAPTSSGLPDIPPPLLPSEASRLEMNNYFTSTPLSQDMARTMTASANQLHAKQQLAAEQCGQQQPNPFQEAAQVMPPILPQPSGMLVRVGSEAHMIPEHQAIGLQKINVTGSRDVFQHKQASMPLSRLDSVNSTALQRTASESMLKHLQERAPLSLDVLPHSSSITNMQVDAFQQYTSVPQTSSLMHQHSLPATSSLTCQGSMLPQHQLHSQCSMPSALGFAGSTAQLPSSVFSECTEIADPYGTSAALSQMNSGMSYDSSLRSCQTADMDFISSMMQPDAAAINRSLSTSSLMHPANLPSYGGSNSINLPLNASSAQLYTLQHDTSRNPATLLLPRMGLLPPMPTSSSRDSGPMDSHMANASDATDLLAELGVDVSIPECHEPLSLQIGGEELHMYDAKMMTTHSMGEDAFMLGSEQP